MYVSMGQVVDVQPAQSNVVTALLTAYTARQQAKAAAAAAAPRMPVSFPASVPLYPPPPAPYPSRDWRVQLPSTPVILGVGAVLALGVVYMMIRPPGRRGARRGGKR